MGVAGARLGVAPAARVRLPSACCCRTAVWSVVVTVVQAGSVPEGVGVVTATESALAAQKGFITGDYVPIEVRACSVVAL